MELGLVNTFSAITGGEGALTSSRMNVDSSKFSDLIKSIQSKEKETLSSSQIIKDGKLNGDFASGYSGTFTSAADKSSLPQGAAANQANNHVQTKKIDKTSKLYEKSLELEGFFVKQMLSEMRKTINKSALASNDFAGKMYEDMLFDEYATSMTKNAGFGLADQIYLSLSV
ncbi:MAG: rod-binding protein [Treponema sp.]|nr:rod-binding protein [Treponema sp.]